LAENGVIRGGDLGIFRKERSLSPFGGGKAPTRIESETPKDRREALEKEILVQSLLRNKGNREAVSVELGIGRTTLWRRMKKLGLLES
jgi:transcriptional regulator of acetoin/glycerol metabolism